MYPIAAGTVAPADPGGRPVRWAATGRFGGISVAPFDSLNLADHVGDDVTAVAANRVTVAGMVGLSGDRVCVLRPVHGADVAMVDSPGLVDGADGAVTRQPGLGLVALGADCVPLALVGTDGQTVAAVHCGWRGLAADVVGAVVGVMRDQGTDVRLAVLGPAVCGRCYPVPAARAAELVAGASAAVSGAALITTPDGQPGIDVRNGVRMRLAELGVAAARVRDVGGCTVEDPGLFSYRRDGVTGRQGIIVSVVGAE